MLSRPATLQYMKLAREMAVVPAEKIAEEDSAERSTEHDCQRNDGICVELHVEPTSIKNMTTQRASETLPRTFYSCPTFFFTIEKSV